VESSNSLRSNRGGPAWLADRVRRQLHRIGVVTSRVRGLGRNLPRMTQTSLFAPEPGAMPAKPAGRLQARMRVLITVKAAPNPSETYGETVCVAGLRLDPNHAGWVRLYPINFRELDSDSKFAKYDVVSLTARPNPGDPRPESWRPEIDTLTVEGNLPPWRRRQDYVNDYVEGTTCGLIEAARTSASAKSLAAIRPRQVTGIDIEPHGAWTAEQQRKIDRYVNQLPLLPDLGRRTALEAPRFKGWYRYLCQDPSCGGHRQGIYDWEWVAFQRNNLHGLGDQEAHASLRQKFLLEICGASNDLVFFLGNQQARPHGFMVLGMFYPPLKPRR